MVKKRLQRSHAVVHSVRDGAALPSRGHFSKEMASRLATVRARAHAGSVSPEFQRFYCFIDGLVSSGDSARGNVLSALGLPAAGFGRSIGGPPPSCVFRAVARQAALGVDISKAVDSVSALQHVGMQGWRNPQQ